jgi:hypothetical protein
VRRPRLPSDRRDQYALFFGAVVFFIMVAILVALGMTGHLGAAG